MEYIYNTPQVLMKFLLGLPSEVKNAEIEHHYTITKDNVSDMFSIKQAADKLGLMLEANKDPRHSKDDVEVFHVIVSGSVERLIMYVSTGGLEWTLRHERSIG